MKAVMYRGVGQIAIEEIEKPVIRENEYLVRVLVSGLCGTDVKTYKQGHRMFTPPCVLGHEFCGQIVEAGEKMDASAVGKIIACAPYVGCGHCDCCRSGHEELCAHKVGTDGAFTEYLVVGEELARKGVVVLGEDADIQQMTLTEPFACILNSMSKSQVQAGQNALVIGAGPMGLLHIEGLKLWGAKKIIVTEYNEERGRIAEKMGAVVINPGKTDNLKQALTEALAGEMLHQIFVCAGITSAVEDAVSLADNGTTVNIFGGLKSGSIITIDPNVIHYNEVRLVGTFGFSSEHFLSAAKFLSSGKVNLRHLITNVYPLSQAAEAFRLAANPTPDVVKVLIEMR